MAPILRNGGSQSPDRWLREPQNNQTPQELALVMRLKSFRVPEMAHILEEQLKDPNADLNTFMERMTAMVDAEWQARADKRFNRLMKEAHLRYPAADLDETIYRPERQLDTQTIETA